MKYITVALLTVALLMVSGITFGQTEKFTMYASGSFSYNQTGIDINIDPTQNSSGSVSRYTIETMNTMPAVGFLFARRWAAGVIMPYQWRRIINDFGSRGNNSSKDIMYRFGPMIEYYQPIYKGFYASGKIGYCFGNVSVKRENVSPSVIVLKTQGITVSGALMYFITKKIAAEALVVLTGDNSSEYNAAKGNNFYTDHLNFQLGLKTFFGHSWKN